MASDNPQDIVDLERGRKEKRSRNPVRPGYWVNSGDSDDGESSNSPSPIRSQRDGGSKYSASRWPLLSRTPSNNHKKKQSSDIQNTPNRLSDIIIRRIRVLVNATSCLANIPASVVVITLQSILLFGLLLYIRSPYMFHKGSGMTQSRSVDEIPPLVDKDVMSSTISHLIVVPGHAVVSDWHANSSDDSAWWLYEYQKGHSVPSLLLSHIEAGVKVANEDPNSLLMFSGGATRQYAGPRTEASSYFYMADAMGWWGHTSVCHRTVLEEYARDSFENTLFTLARFREVVGRYPLKITIVGFDFKEDRFRKQHRTALHLPEHMFHYKGIISNVGNFDIEAALKGEKETSIQFEQNPYACKDELSNVLFDKRTSRDPFRRMPPYTLSAPEMADLLK